MGAPLRHLLQLVSLRRLAGVPVRAALSISGIALGVCVPVAVLLINDAVLGSVERGVEAVAGKVDLEVSAGAAGVAEAALDRVRGVGGVAHVAPILELTASVLAPRGVRGDGLQIVGIDTLGDDHFQGDPLEQGADVQLDDPIAFLNATDSVLLARPFAGRARVGVGGTIRVATALGARDLTVRGLLRPGGLARANGGDVAIMDVYAMQILFGRQGRFDRIQVAVERGRGEEDVARGIRRELGDGVDVEPPSRRAGRVERMLVGIQSGLLMGSVVALLVGVFLIFNTVSIAVVERRQEIGILRALGVTRGAITRLFALEACALGLLGGALGVPLGVLLSRALLATVSEAVTSFYLRVNVAAVTPDARTAVGGVCLGVLTTFVAALAPARAAAVVSPVETLRRGAPAMRMPRRVRRSTAATGAVLLALAAVATRVRPIDGLPIGGYFSAFGILMGCSLLVPTALHWLRGPMRVAASAAFGEAGRLAADGLARAPGRTAVTVAAVGVSVAMVINAGALRKTFHASLDRWIRQSVPADLFVSASAGFVGTRNTPLQPTLAAELARIEGVEAVDLVRLARGTFRGEAISIVSDVRAIHARYAETEFLQGSPQEAIAAAARGQVGVSESFARRYGIWRGDRLTLRTPAGEKSYEVCCVVVDYSSERGAVMLDRAQYLRDFGDETVDSFSVYLEPGARGRAPQIRREILRRFGARWDLQVRTNRELRALILGFVDEIFEVMRALRLVALFIAAMGVANSLFASVLDRTREIGMLRAIGASRSQVRRMVLAEATLIGLSGCLAGAPSGFLVSLMAIKVLNVQLRGWALPYHADLWALVEAAVLVTLAAALAGLPPSRRATAIEPIAALRAE